MLEISETTEMALAQPNDLIVLARKVLRLAPVEAGSAAQIGVIHTRLNAIRLDPRAEEVWCSIAGLVEAPCPDRGHSVVLDRDLARVISLVFAIYAGDIPDPTHGATRAVFHDKVGPSGGWECTALLGKYLFYKKSFPI